MPENRGRGRRPRPLFSGPFTNRVSPNNIKILKHKIEQKDTMNFIECTGPGLVVNEVQEKISLVAIQVIYFVLSGL